MPFSWAPVHDHDDAVKVLHHAFDLGMNLVNTADIYAPSAEEVGHNERLVGDAVRAYPGGREALTVITKNGLRREGERWWRDNSRDWMLRAAEHSNEMLGFTPDVIAVHRVNREQSWSECIEALLEVRERGLTLRIGLSNVTIEEFDAAWNISGGTICIVEQERSPYYRGHTDVLDACAERGVAYLAWSPLGGGDKAKRLPIDHPEFSAIAEHHRTSAQNIALAWLMAQGPHLIPIPGFTRRESADAAAAAAHIRLSADELARLNASPSGASVQDDEF
jgi:aryl-alcohol dehydrogenase-like predicted oxidoreductase